MFLCFTAADAQRRVCFSVIVLFMSHLQNVFKINININKHQDELARSSTKNEKRKKQTLYFHVSGCLLVFLKLTGPGSDSPPPLLCGSGGVRAAAPRGRSSGGGFVVTFESL